MLIDYGAVCDPDTGTGLELWNNARTLAYVNKGIKPDSAQFKPCSCDTLVDLLEEAQPYEKPDLGGMAPWFDNGDIDSTKFAGILMLDIQGIDDASVDRQIIGGLNVGASFGPLRQRHKVFTFRALLIGSDHCGVNFGLNWLKRTLHNLDDGCEFSDLNMFECCPCIDADCDGELDKAVAKYERTFKKVALLNGPRVTQRYGASCGCGCGGCSMMEVEWSFGIGLPYKFTSPKKVINGVTARNFPVRCVEWYVPGPNEDCSCGVASCDTCGTSVSSPPRAPSIDLGGGSCSQPIVYAEECYRIGREALPDTGDTVVKVTVENAGGEPVYGATVVIIPNANGTPCDELDDCDACATISAECVPPYSTWIADPTTRQATIICEGVRAPSSLSSTNCFPVLDPCVDYCICVRFAGTPPPNVKITVELITRES